MYHECIFINFVDKSSYSEILTMGIRQVHNKTMCHGEGVRNLKLLCFPRPHWSMPLAHRGYRPMRDLPHFFSGAGALWGNWQR